MFDASKKAEDVGTRLEHLFDLHDLWGWAYAMRTNESYHTEYEEEQARQLKVAIDLLNHVLTCYQGETIVPSVINGLPKDARDIPIT